MQSAIPIGKWNFPARIAHPVLLLREFLASMRREKRYLRRLSRLSPYIAAVFLPGGFVLLPALVWWLHRRRSRRLPPRG